MPKSKGSITEISPYLYSLYVLTFYSLTDHRLILILRSRSKVELVQLQHVILPVSSAERIQSRSPNLPVPGLREFLLLNLL